MSMRTGMGMAATQRAATMAVMAAAALAAAPVRLYPGASAVVGRSDVTSFNARPGSAIEAAAATPVTPSPYTGSIGSAEQRAAAYVRPLSVLTCTHTASTPPPTFAIRTLCSRVTAV